VSRGGLHVLGGKIEQIGPFRVVEELPRGNTGRVFMAEDPKRRTGGDGTCVVKVFDDVHVHNERFLNVMRREAPSAVHFAHPFAARHIDVAYTGKQAFVAREFVDGMPVGALMERMRVQDALLPWEFICTLGVQIARLFATAQNTPWQSGETAGLLHGHLCCSSAYVTFSGFAKVVGMGFGRSRVALPAGRRQLNFRAPELLLGESISAAADVYGLGALLHALLCGQRTFERACVADTRQAVLHEDPGSIRELRPEVPLALEQRVMSMMAKRPGERPEDLAAIEAGFRELLLEPDAFYADQLASTMTIYFPELAQASHSRRRQGRIRRRLSAPTPVPARPSRQSPDRESLRARDTQERRRPAHTPPALRAVTDEGPTPLPRSVSWADEITPSLAGLEAAEPFDVESVVDLIVASGSEVPGLDAPARDPLEDLVIEPPQDPLATLPPFEEVTPAAVERSGDLLMAADMGLEAGTVMGGRYRLLAMLGQGGASVVYRAEHIDLMKPVAVKVLKPELSSLEEAMERFQREARAVSRLDHPNVVRVTDFGRTSNGSLFLVMELVQGQCLAEVLRSRPILPTSMVVSIAMEVLEGLAHAHEHGLVHRDLKPDNVMVDYSGGRIVAKVLDFGIAKVIEERCDGSLTQPGRVFGTPRYMAPEQAKGAAVDARADLYAVGVCLYEMLSGRPPFPGEHAIEILQKVLNETPPRLVLEPCPTMRTERVAAVVERAMHKDPAQRYRSAAEMSAALRDCFFLGGPAPRLHQPHAP